MSNPNKYKMLEISMAHITQEVAESLMIGAWSQTLCYVPWFDSGVIIDVNSDGGSDIPRSLNDVLEWAHSLNVDFLKLDQDGPVIGNLTTYDW